MATTELKLLRLLGEKDSWDRFNTYIKPHILSDNGKQVYSGMKKYYKEGTTIEDNDWSPFLEWFFLVMHPTMKPSTQSVYKAYIDGIEEIEEDDLPQTILQSYIKRDYMARIADTCLQAVEENSKDMEDIEKLVEQYNTEIGRVSITDTSLMNSSMEELFEDMASDKGLEWGLEELNVAIGPIRPSWFVVLGARQGKGKTSFISSQIAHIIPQVSKEGPIIWLNNEGDGDEIRYRIVNAVLGMSDEEIRKDPVRALKQYRSKIGGDDRIRVYNPIHHIEDVKRIIEETSPALVVVDQVWNLGGFEKSGNETVRQGLLFAEVRKLAVLHCPIIGVHQLSGEAINVEYPDDSMMHLSRTAIQANADVILTMGAKDSYGYENIRYLNVAKHKRISGPRVDKSIISKKFEIKFDPDRCTFRGAYSRPQS